MTGRNTAPGEGEGEGVSGRSSNNNYYGTLSETDPSEQQHPTPLPSLLSKTDRKKLKKLRKRAALVLTESERSGLLTRSEYEEYEALLRLESENDARQKQQPGECDRNEKAIAIAKSNGKSYTAFSNSNASTTINTGPSINLRKKCLGIEKVEAATQRDLMSWLLQQKFDGLKKIQQQQPSSRKRRRDEAENLASSVAIPHWASVHNPGTCEQVAVLEIHLPHDNIDSYRRFLESCRRSNHEGIHKTADAERESENENKNISEIERADQCFPHSQIGVATKWFQGHMPKSMSESLLYFSNAKKEHSKKKNEEEMSSPSRDQFLKRLEEMLLSTEEMTEQGYPSALPMSAQKDSTGVAADSESEAISAFVSRTENFRSPETFSLEKANEYVATFGVRVESQDDEDKSSYISTPLAASSTKNDLRPVSVRVLGLDCEMVLTTAGSELARVTLIEFDEFVGPKTSSKTTVLLDCIVRPQNRVVDYLTKHSGITPALLKPVSTRLEQVQCALASYLTPEDILVGHSLENDFRALRYIHPRIVDTSMVFRPSDQTKRFKFSLRHLSATLLKKPIQNGSHCSEEDAQTALDLALLKALKGDDLRVPGFGDNQRQSLLRQRFVKQSVAAFIGPNSWLEAHITKHPSSAHALNYDAPNDCKKAMIAWMTNSSRAQLIWSKIEFENKTGSGSVLAASLEVFKSVVTEIVEKLPPSCVLMIAIQGELQNAKDMFKRRGACRDPRSTVIWSDNDEETWKNLLNSTRAGYVQWFSAPINTKK